MVLVVVPCLGIDPRAGSFLESHRCACLYLCFRRRATSSPQLSSPLLSLASLARTQKKERKQPSSSSPILFPTKTTRLLFPSQMPQGSASSAPLQWLHVLLFPSSSFWPSSSSVPPPSRPFLTAAENAAAPSPSRFHSTSMTPAAPPSPPFAFPAPPPTTTSASPSLPSPTSACSPSSPLAPYSSTTPRRLPSPAIDGTPT